MSNKEKKAHNILYKIYYDDVLVYLGRTHQELTDRIRMHVFKEPRLKVIDINFVTKIEYAEFPTEADMFLYEIYYINKYKPPINCDDKACDNLTVSLPEVEFHNWTSPLWSKWKKAINEKDIKRQHYLIEKEEKEINWDKREKEALSSLKNENITSDEYYELMQVIEQERVRFDYENNKISFSEYCDKMGFHELKKTK